MKFDPKQCAAVLAVIETGSFEQAASRLHLTSSAVSQRVRALEIALGSPLLVRSRPCRATPAGQRLLQYLRRAQLLEQDFKTEFAGNQSAALTLAVAVNADSLASWLLPALAEFLIREQVLLDLTVDDQNHTYALLEGGLALGCISAEPLPMRGCMAEPLGAMRYRCMASPDYRQRWFPDGMNRTAARLAPVLTFDRKDRLQADFLLQHFGLTADAYPCHFIPASEAYLQAVCLGLGWGMIPELQMAHLQANGALVELAPEQPADIGLFWHRWKVQSPRLELMSATLVQAARRVLLY